MKTVGNTTTFEYVFQSPNIEDLRKGKVKLIIVYFDGQPDLCGATDTAKGIEELREYYQRDWKKTGRLLPMLIYSIPEYDNILCF